MTSFTVEQNLKTQALVSPKSWDGGGRMEEEWHRTLPKVLVHK